MNSSTQFLPVGYGLHWYEILSVLGKGGFGITYLAQDTNLHQQVAIKEYLPGDFAIRGSDAVVEPLGDNDREAFDHGLVRFLEEARTLARFRHANIVVVHSVFEANDTAYMVMEYEQGRSLAEAYKTGRVATERDILRFLIPLLDGLGLVHEAGFIHRDIKPDNILLRADDQPVLIDFGSARESVGNNRQLTSVLTPGYAPFEQWGVSEDVKQGPWTDIYALAATVYRGITGTQPENALTRATAILHEKPDPIAAATEVCADKFSKPFLQAIDKALAFKPENRTQSVEEWRAELAEAVHNAGLSYSNLGSVRRMTRNVGSPALPATPATLPAGGGEMQEERTEFAPSEPVDSESKTELVPDAKDPTFGAVDEDELPTERFVAISDPEAPTQIADAIDANSATELAPQPLGAGATAPSHRASEATRGSKTPLILGGVAVAAVLAVAGAVLLLPAEGPVDSPPIAQTSVAEPTETPPIPVVAVPIPATTPPTPAPVTVVGATTPVTTPTPAVSTAPTLVVSTAASRPESVVRVTPAPPVSTQGTPHVIIMDNPKPEELLAALQNDSATTLVPLESTPPGVAPPVPVPVKAEPVVTLAAARAALGSAKCSAVRVEKVQGAWRLHGYAGPVYETPGAFRQLMAADTVRTDITAVSPRYCAVLDALGGFWSAAASSQSIAALRLNAGHGRLVEGEALVAQLTLPGAGDYFYLDYHVLDGTVVHLVPNLTTRPNRQRARSSVRVGAGEDWIVSKPFGEELLVLITASRPLFDTPREEAEDQLNYLRALSGRLRQLANAPEQNRVAVAFLPIVTRPSGTQ